MRYFRLPPARLAPAFGLLILGLASLGARAEIDTPAIDLKFSWPDGLRAKATQIKSNARMGTEPMAMTSSYTMTASRVTNNTLVSFGKIRLESGSALTAMTAKQRSQVEVMARASLPSYLISQEGSFTSIYKLDAFRKSLRDPLTDLLKGMGADDQAIQRTLDTAISEPVLTELAKSEWNLIVGYWAGASLKGGTAYESSSKGALPLIPDSSVSMNSRFALNKEIPCRRSGVIRKCVELEMTTVADREEVAKAIEAMLKTLSGKENMRDVPLIEALDVVTVFRLTTEPAGLIPHQYSLRKTIRVKTAGGEDSQERTEIQDTQVIYKY